MNSLIAKKWGVGIFLAVWVLGAGAAEWQRFEGRVVGVLDGDTIDVLMAEKRVQRVRLIGIDAPEKSQPFGRKSKQHLSDLVFGSVVAVQWQHRDRNQRIIGKVVFGGHDVNLEMVRSGLAWWYEQFQKEQTVADRELYDVAEKAARKKRSGLWSDQNPVPPWEFRHSRKSK